MTPPAAFLLFSCVVTHQKCSTRLMYYYYNIIRIVSTESPEFMSIWSPTPSLAKNYIWGGKILRVLTAAANKVCGCQKTMLRNVYLASAFVCSAPVINLNSVKIYFARYCLLIKPCHTTSHVHTDIFIILFLPSCQGNKIIANVIIAAGSSWDLRVLTLFSLFSGLFLTMSSKIGIILRKQA